MYPSSRKAQSEVLSKVVVVLILLALSSFAYTWGSNLIEAQKMRSEVEEIQSKFLELKTKITEVANAGNGSARFVDLKLEYGILSIEPGEPCSGTDPDNNMLRYVLSTKDNFVDSLTWALSDSANKNLNCIAPYENSSSGIIISKSTVSEGLSMNEYALWFRKLNQSGNTNQFLINLTTGSADSDMRLTAGSHQIRVESQGSVQVGTSSYTKVLISDV